MKQLLGKKRINLLILGVAIILAGCDTGSSSDDGYQGVLGQVAGVVYDSLTGNPVPDVEVTLAGYRDNLDTEETDDGNWIVTKTDVTGAYLFKDVVPANYTVTYRKGTDYRFVTRKLTVDPLLYVIQDPFKEVEIFEVLQGDGNKKVGYVYSQNLRIELVELVPLSTKLEGYLYVVEAGAHNIESGILPAAKPAADVELWFVEDSTYKEFLLGRPSVGSSAGKKDEISGIIGDKQALAAVYGPVKTGADGKFTSPGLPAGYQFNIVYANFIQNDFYFGDTAFYGADYKEIDYAVGFGGEYGKYGNINVANLFLFAQGTATYITNVDAGTNVAPKDPKTGVIKLTFNKPVDTLTFKVEALEDRGNSNDGIWGENATYFNVTWNLEGEVEGAVPNTIVTLTPAKPIEGQVTPGLPYSTNPKEPIGYLKLADAKGTDGQDVTNKALSMPVFTAQGIRLAPNGVKLEGFAPGEVPAEILANRAMYTTEKVIKLTFTKEVGTAKFVLNNKFPRYLVKGTDVFVRTDLLNNDGQDLFYAVAAAADPADTYGFNAGSIEVAQTENKVPQLINRNFNSLELINTNIPNITAGTVKNQIVLTFKNPENVTPNRYEVSLYNSRTHNTDRKIGLRTVAYAKNVGLTSTTNIPLDTLTVTPVDLLRNGEEYYLLVKIYNTEDNVLFSTYYADNTDFGSRYGNFVTWKQWFPGVLNLTKTDSIWFTTPVDPEYLYGPNTFTTLLDDDGAWQPGRNAPVSGTGTDFLYSQSYYIQFNRELPPGGLTSSTATAVTVSTGIQVKYSNSNVEVHLEKWNPDSTTNGTVDTLRIWFTKRTTGATGSVTEFKLFFEGEEVTINGSPVSGAFELQ